MKHEESWKNGHRWIRDMPFILLFLLYVAALGGIGVWGELHKHSGMNCAA